MLRADRGALAVAYALTHIRTFAATVTQVPKEAAQTNADSFTRDRVTDKDTDRDTDKRQHRQMQISLHATETAQTETAQAETAQARAQDIAHTTHHTHNGYQGHTCGVCLTTQSTQYTVRRPDQPKP